jgi:hypothetical protein
VQEGWTTINLPFTSFTDPYRYIRYTSGQYCDVNEMQFLGYRFSNVANSACPVTVSVSALAPVVTPVRVVVLLPETGAVLEVAPSLACAPCPLRGAASFLYW